MNPQQFQNNTGNNQNQPNNLRKNSTNGSQQTNQKQQKVYILDLSTPSKQDAFKEERKFKIFERIAPYLREEEQKKDLKWSLEEIKKSYEGELKKAKNEKSKNCEDYCKNNHRVTTKQVQQMFGFFTKM